MVQPYEYEERLTSSWTEVKKYLSGWLAANNNYQRN